MLKITASADGRIGINATIRGVPVYLDHCAIIQLAKGDPDRRGRFVNALHGGADLLFSVGNAWELAGPLGGSVKTLRGFLDEIGPNWFPTELDAHAVVEREIRGTRGPEACLSRKFVKDLLSFATRPQGRVMVCDSSVFQLGAVCDWMQSERESLEGAKVEFDAALVERIAGYRVKYERDPSWLDKTFPDFGFFNQAMRCTFTYNHVVRRLVIEAKAYHLKKGDGVDFCHAVIGASFARAVTLDKHWTRRIDCLPKPNDLAKSYSVSQLDELVMDLEDAVGRLQQRHAGVA